MKRHFFLDKTNSIIYGSRANVGLNPILKLNYGKDISRGLIHFNIEEIKKLYKDNEINDKITFHLKMTNCFSVDGVPYEKILTSAGNSFAKRASSFTLMLFRLPQDFDEGRGFDFDSDFWIGENKSHSEEGSSWYFAQTGIPWQYEKNKVNFYSGLSWGTLIRDANLKGGIYSQNTLKSAYENYVANGKDDIIIGMQHFDFGGENLDIDITSYVKEILADKSPNYGLGLAFIPSLENTKTEFSQYVGFFTDNTNTFFHPYVEMYCHNEIHDDRDNFCIGKDNNILLYANLNGEAINLDNIPTCTISNNIGEVKVQCIRKGVYCATIPKSLLKEISPKTIIYDTWTNLSYNGDNIDDVEMETEVKSNMLQIGNKITNLSNAFPLISGIHDNENLNRDETRDIQIDFCEKYDKMRKISVSNCEYRIYVKDGSREMDVFDFTPIEHGFLKDFFTIYTQDMIPNKYFIDIRIKDKNNIKYFKDVLHFNIVSNVTERYE